jgi:hypothetical protein
LPNITSAIDRFALLLRIEAGWLIGAESANYINNYSESFP